MHTEISLSRPNENPFESIKRHDAQGNEYWSARELMPLLGYKQWRRFKDVIEVAQENVETITPKVIEHFLPVEAKTKGRPSLDYMLSRLAAYHTALACDARGNEQVKAAKHYFVVKAREAEVVIPKQSEELERLKMILEIERSRLGVRQTDMAMLAMHGKEITLALRGQQDQIVEVDRHVLEVIDQRCGDRRTGMTTKQLNDYLKQKTGHNFKNGTELKRYLQRHAPELLDLVQRPINQDFINEENIEAAMRVLEKRDRQRLIGE